MEGVFVQQATDDGVPDAGAQARDGEGAATDSMKRLDPWSRALLVLVGASCIPAGPGLPGAVVALGQPRCYSPAMPPNQAHLVPGYRVAGRYELLYPFAEGGMAGCGSPTSWDRGGRSGWSRSRPSSPI